MKKTLNCLFVFLLALTAQAQSTLNATGGSTVINGNTYSYSIGEMVLVNTISTANLVVSQGLLQASDASVGIEDLKLTEKELKIYPNPTKNILNLKASLENKGDFKLKLYDITGKELLSQDWNMEAAMEEHQLNLESYAVGSYVLKVEYKNGNSITEQSYKIQKIN